jgi:hypothetical protein
VRISAADTIKVTVNPATSAGMVEDSQMVRRVNLDSSLII